MARKKKKEKKKELTKNQKIGLTIAVILLTPAITLTIILYRSFQVKGLLDIAGKTKTEQENIMEKDLPTNDKKLPYVDPTSKYNKVDFSDHFSGNPKMNIKRQAAEGIASRAGLGPQAVKMAGAAAGGGRKKNRKKQRGGGEPSQSGTPPGFMSLKRCDYPYSWTRSDSTFLEGLGHYFTCMNIENRKFEQAYRLMIGGMFYNSPRVKPNGDFWGKIFWQIEDFAKLTIGLGLADFIKYCVFIPYQIYLLFSCSFSAGFNPIMWIIMLIFAFYCIFILWVPTMGFFPFNFFIILLLSSILVPSKGKWDLFYQVVDMYRYVWAATMWLVIGIAVPSIWGWSMKNGDPNWMPIICSWVFPPLIFFINYLIYGELI